MEPATLSDVNSLIISIGENNDDRSICIQRNVNAEGEEYR